MGTRHLICVFHRGRFVIAQYGQLDGYPEGQGFTIIAFLLGAGNIARLKAGLTHIYTPTAEEVSEIEKEASQMVHEYWEKSVREGFSLRGKIQAACPTMSPETSAGVLELVAKATAEAPVPIQQKLTFINDGLFCEWGYVIDLDAEVLEVFCGLEKEHEGSSKRFKDVEGAEEGLVPSLIKSFAFAELPEKKDDLVRVVNGALELRAREAMAREQRNGGSDDAVAVASVL
ncbi:hypothetical protein VF21_07555 [Pseudogymnoascus sp. 05NY08]|nr:hypothetical protein VF21_07555 [Pseudogymnoascus sp. 05NY08]